MRNPLWLLKRVVAAIVVLAQSTAAAQVTMDVSFNRPVVVGEATTPTIQLSGEWSSHTACEDYLVSRNYTAKWGDGETSSWYFRSDGGGFGGPAFHSYISPGRYRVSVRLDWSIRATHGSSPCSPTSGTLTDAAYVDVTPDEPTLVNGWIGTFMDPAGSVCNGPILPFGRVYVVVGLAGETAGGIAGAEFRLRSSEPTDFFFSAVPLDGWIMIGNPFGDGATLGAVCMSNSSNRVGLIEVTAFAIDGATDGHLFVERHRTPSNAQYPDITLIRCDAPFFTPVGAGRGHSALLNPSADGGSCTTTPVAVKTGSWSSIKGLYRNRNF